VQTKQEIDFNSLEIDCKRVRLIPITQKFSDEIFSEFTDEISRYMVPATPANIEEIEFFINASIERMEKKTDIIFVILKRDNNEFLGVCGLHGSANPREPVLGIWLKKSAHGNHYGREAIRYLAEWTRNNIDINFMIYPCDKDNIASRKVAEHLNGFIFHEGKTETMSGNILNEVAYKIL
jgi:ribosomal-protein-alanine N-acetyltransferase